MPIGFPEEVPFGRPLGEEIAGEEISLEAGPEEAAGAEAPTQIPGAAEPKAPAAPAAKKEKPFKKKKPKAEGEKAVRPKKSERRVIEEKIAEEESVQEALSAIKEKEEEGPEARGRERKEEFKPVAKEEPKFGIFGDLLKSALKKKDDKKPEGEAELEDEPGKK